MRGIVLSSIAIFLGCCILGAGIFLLTPKDEVCVINSMMDCHEEIRGSNFYLEYVVKLDVEGCSSINWTLSFGVDAGYDCGNYWSRIYKTRLDCYSYAKCDVHTFPMTGVAILMIVFGCVVICVSVPFGISEILEERKRRSTRFFNASSSMSMYE
ncbi:Transmembrane domain-containing protein [Orpheovirus IHUMI-LCC2]|uniref:Transmembrane domain-containing protein n=1 Tax=Orpheovirus IHUMI-LCC2 TaxID=2023057 RepID=A0A2I2L5A7_9VIRU|nr:Transmembrane domain-containing protein [Orpheovirus IHUMI-LCC2]SNW62714.1 Transmembrane domain-containing protein [Orpheovirus IHUMI-LCC2]